MGILGGSKEETQPLTKGDQLNPLYVAPRGSMNANASPEQSVSEPSRISIVHEGDDDFDWLLVCSNGSIVSCVKAGPHSLNGGADGVKVSTSHPARG
jgi:hypothetical protein